LFRLWRSRKLNARAGKKEVGWGEGIFARPRFPIPIFSPPNFVPVKLVRHPFLAETEKAESSSQKKDGPKGKKL